MYSICLYSRWLNSVIYSATNYWAEVQDAIWRRSDVILTFLTSVFVSTTLDGLKCFFRVKKRKKGMLTSALQSKLLAGYLYSTAESWKNLKDTITFSSSSMC